MKNKNKKVKVDKSIKEKTDGDVWKKIFLFLILFFPYAIYLFLFKTKVSVYIKSIVVTILAFLTVLVVDMTMYPNRVHNEVILQELNTEKANNEIAIGEVYHIEKRKHFKYKDSEYISAIVFDPMNMYYSVFDVVDYNKNYDLVYLYKLDMSEDIVYDKNRFAEFKEVHPIVLEEILTNTQFIEFKDIKDIKKVVEDDLFYNTKSQTLSILDEVVTFEFNEFGVVSFKSKSGNLSSEDIFNPLLNTEFNSVYTVINRNFGEKFDIVGYNYYNGIHSFNVEVGKSKYVVEYYYGEGASLQSIDDEKVYMDFLKSMYL